MVFKRKLLANPSPPPPQPSLPPPTFGELMAAGLGAELVQTISNYQANHPMLTPVITNLR